MSSSKASIYMTCPMCSEINYINFETLDEIKRYDKYKNGEGLIQDIFPEFTPFEREFIKTGYCVDCQCLLFAKERPQKELRIKKY